MHSHRFRVLCFPVKNVLRAEKELNMYAANIDEATAGANAERDASLAKVYERLGDSLCYLGLFELGLGNYLKQVASQTQQTTNNASNLTRRNEMLKNCPFFCCFRCFVVVKLSLAKRMGKTNAEMAVIYASIGQTYQDLDAYDKAVKYFQLELETNSLNMKSVRVFCVFFQLFFFYLHSREAVSMACIHF